MMSATSSRMFQGISRCRSMYSSRRPGENFHGLLFSDLPDHVNHFYVQQLPTAGGSLIRSGFYLRSTGKCFKMPLKRSGAVIQMISMAMMCANRKCGRRENSKTDLCLIIYLISFWLILKGDADFKCYVFRGLESGVGQLTNDKALPCTTP